MKNSKRKKITLVVLLALFIPAGISMAVTETKPVVIPGVVFSGTSFAPPVSSAQNQQPKVISNPALAVSLSADKIEVNSGESYIYQIRYKNIGVSSADNVELKAFLSDRVELKMIAPVCYALEKDFLVFKLGRVEKGQEGFINIDVSVKQSVKAGGIIKTKTIVEYTDALGNGKKKVEDSLDIKVVQNKLNSNVAAVGFSSGILLVFLLSILVDLFIIYYVYLIWKEIKKQPRFRE